MRTKEEAIEELRAKVRAKLDNCCFEHLYRMIDTLMDDKQTPPDPKWQVMAHEYVFKRGPWAKWIEKTKERGKDD